jgi:hypothetical protein
MSPVCTLTGEGGAKRRERVGSFTQSTESANIEINVVPRLFRATLRAGVAKKVELMIFDPLTQITILS